MQYEFERITTDYGTGYSLFGGVKVGTEGHQEIILRRASEGWRYVGFIPVSQRGTGHIEEMDLVFEKDGAGPAISG